jgi:cytochrome c oxidase assembly protein subunit 11
MASLRARHRWVVLGLIVAFGAMVALVASSVQIYNLVCRVTGMGGTTQVATEAQADAIAAQGGKFPFITVRFNADLNSDMPWSFYPVQREVKVQIGVPQTIYYRAINRSTQRVTGTATFNVTPLQVGAYFDKIQCFCFTEQTLDPGQSVDMPVRFFVDPAILKDPDGGDFKTITLSYTFFRAKDQPSGTPQASNNGKNNTSLN